MSRLLSISKEAKTRLPEQSRSNEHGAQTLQKDPSHHCEKNKNRLEPIGEVKLVFCVFLSPKPKWIPTVSFKKVGPRAKTFGNHWFK